MADSMPTLSLTLAGGALLVIGNLTWSLVMSPVLRNLARSLLLRVSPRRGA